MQNHLQEIWGKNNFKDTNYVGTPTTTKLFCCCWCKLHNLQFKMRDHLSKDMEKKAISNIINIEKQETMEENNSKLNKLCRYTNNKKNIEK